MASETWSAILSGCPSPTDSEVKRKVLSEEAKFQSILLELGPYASGRGCPELVVVCLVC